MEVPYFQVFSPSFLKICQFVIMPYSSIITAEMFQHDA